MRTGTHPLFAPLFHLPVSVSLSDHDDDDSGVRVHHKNLKTSHQNKISEYHNYYEKRGEQRIRTVERKMTKLFQLSEELAARKLKEKLRRDKIKENEERREKELRDLAESLERKEQERSGSIYMFRIDLFPPVLSCCPRLMRKINKQVWFLKANVIDLARYAKLPKHVVCDPTV
jgi:hypothetical protein